MQYNKLTGNIDKESLMLLLVQLSHAVRLEDTSQVISSLAKLANYALDSGYVRGKELIGRPEVGPVHVAMLLFNAVDQCAAGQTESYSDLYGLCTQLTRKILNGDVEVSTHVF